MTCLERQRCRANPPSMEPASCPPRLPWDHAMGAEASTNARDGMARRALVVPRGHDLLPSMRVPVLDPISAPAAHPLCLLKSTEGNDQGGLPPGGAGGGQRSWPTDGGSAATPEKIVEYVPWVGGGSSRGVCTDTAPAGEAGGTETAPRSIADDFRDRTQWFSSSLPMEALPSGTSPVREGGLHAGGRRA